MNESLNYGLTIASKGQEALLKELDAILKSYSIFAVQKVEEKAALAMGGTVARELSPADLKSEKILDHVGTQCGGIQWISCKVSCCRIRAADQGDFVVWRCVNGTIEARK